MGTPLNPDLYRNRYKTPMPFDVDLDSPGPGSKDEIVDHVSMPPTVDDGAVAQGSLPSVPSLPAFTAAPPNRWPSSAPGL